MSRKHGWTPRVRRSQELPITKLDNKREAGKRVKTPGKPSCKRVRGIVVFYSSGLSPKELYLKNKAEIEKVFGKSGRRKRRVLA